MMDMNNGILKVVKSLAAKKYRDDEGLFVAEGTKCVRDTWQHFNCRWLIAKRSWYEQCGTAEHYDKIVFANGQQMARISQFDTPSDVIAVYEKPADVIDTDRVAKGLNIVLDNIQDPGNLGTIIRLADWFGVLMVHYGDLEALFEQYPDLPVYGTFLDGQNIYQRDLGKQGFVIFGNEGQGISAKVAKHVDSRLLIPKAKTAGSESLNVGVAAAITISEFFRR